MGVIERLGGVMGEEWCKEVGWIWELVDDGW